MTRLRKLLANVLFTIPVLALCAAAPTASARIDTSTPTTTHFCYVYGGHMFCF